MQQLPPCSHRLQNNDETWDIPDQTESKRDRQPIAQPCFLFAFCFLLIFIYSNQAHVFLGRTFFSCYRLFPRICNSLQFYSDVLLLFQKDPFVQASYTKVCWIGMICSFEKKEFGLMIKLFIVFFSQDILQVNRDFTGLDFYQSLFLFPILRCSQFLFEASRKLIFLLNQRIMNVIFQLCIGLSYRLLNRSNHTLQHLHVESYFFHIIPSIPRCINVLR